MNTQALSNDPQIQPNYVPQNKIDYITSNEKNKGISRQIRLFISWLVEVWSWVNI
jgi:hypothetical protein